MRVAGAALSRGDRLEPHTDWRKHAKDVVAASLVVIAAWHLQAQAPAPAPAPTVWDGTYTVAQSDRGRPLYQRHCASCHGAFLEGKDGPPPFAGWHGGAPPLAGLTFNVNWDLLSIGDLFERMRVSMPQKSPGSLSRQTNADILAFIFNQNGYPAGPSELSPDTSTSSLVKIVGWSVIGGR